MKFYGIQVICPTCKKPTLLQEALFCADGSLVLMGWCPDDKLIVRYKTSADKLRLIAQKHDEEPSVPVRPPLQLPAPLFTPEDLEILHHDFHIKIPDD